MRGPEVGDYVKVIVDCLYDYETGQSEIRGEVVNLVQDGQWAMVRTFNGRHDFLEVPIDYLIVLIKGDR